MSIAILLIQKRISQINGQNTQKEKITSNLTNSKGLQLRESLGKTFGKNIVDKVFEDKTISHKADATSGKLRVASTGLLGSIGKTLNANNTFYGEE